MLKEEVRKKIIQGIKKIIIIDLVSIVIALIYWWFKGTYTILKLTDYMSTMGVILLGIGLLLSYRRMSKGFSRFFNPDNRSITSNKSNKDDSKSISSDAGDTSSAGTDDSTEAVNNTKTDQMKEDSANRSKNRFYSVIFILAGCILLLSSILVYNILS